MLEFDIAPADLSALLRAPALTALRAGRARTSRLRTVWHDTAAHSLQGQGLSLAEQGGHWRLERLVPNGEADWLPAAPPPIVAEAESAAALESQLPGKLTPPAAAFRSPATAPRRGWMCCKAICAAWHTTNRPAASS